VCRERLDQAGVRAVSDAELLTILLGPSARMSATREAALRLLDELPLSAIAWRRRTTCSASRASAPRALAHVASQATSIPGLQVRGGGRERSSD